MKTVFDELVSDLETLRDYYDAPMKGTKKELFMQATFVAQLNELLARHNGRAEASDAPPEVPGYPLPDGVQELRDRPVEVLGRPSIDEIAKLLDDDMKDVHILPSGEVVVGTRSTPKVLTLRENLGGEYAG